MFELRWFITMYDAELFGGVKSKTLQYRVKEYDGWREWTDIPIVDETE